MNNVFNKYVFMATLSIGIAGSTYAAFQEAPKKDNSHDALAFIKAIETLMNRKADINEKDKYGKTVLDYMIAEKQKNPAHRHIINSYIDALYKRGACIDCG